MQTTNFDVMQEGGPAMPRYNLFTKIVSLIVIMLMPIAGLYFYSNKTSTDVLRSELNKSSTNQLIFFQNQVNTSIDLLTLWPNLLIHDPDISSLQEMYLNSEFFDIDEITLVKRIETKLSFQESSSDWKSSLFIYSPSLNRVVSDNDVKQYDAADLKKRLKPGWQVKKITVNGKEQFEFSLFTVTPFSTFNHPERANMIVEVKFDSQNIESMLDQFKSDGRRDPFYYKEGIGAIYNSSTDRELTGQLIKRLKTVPFKDTENRTVELDGKTYMVNIVSSSTTGWHMVDYMPVSDIMSPINKSNRMFYVSVGCLLLMSCLVAYLIYAQVQVPIKKLVQAFYKLKTGDYSIRMKPRGNGEFSFVFSRFNSMVEQIQELFERVYLEKIHVREAKLKQLQSQINPHFFYNCFSFISSMAKLNNTQAVVAMSENLSSYYRYTTRQERDLVMLSEEIDFVTSYLEIQKMRMKRLDYSIALPPRMRKLDIPPLVIQPFVENAVIHGIEPHVDAGMIRITGEFGDGEVRLMVEDDGQGMSEQELALLQEKLSMPMDEEMGCGLWNVHQRMHLRFGEHSGLTLGRSPLGGLKVTLKWSQSTEEYAERRNSDD